MVGMSDVISKPAFTFGVITPAVYASDPDARRVANEVAAEIGLDLEADDGVLIEQMVVREATVDVVTFHRATSTGNLVPVRNGQRLEEEYRRVLTRYTRCEVL